VRRAGGVPTAYLRGVREFYGRPFRVGPGVLVPRPETELVVDLARERFARRAGGELRVGDVGTGSGCLAVTLALELAPARTAAVDSEPAALEWARGNARALGAAVELVLGDGPAALAPFAGGGFDLVVSNPPYVDPAEAARLPREVRDHEPAAALFAPAGDPDHWVRRLLAEALPLLRPGGLLLVELGAGQAERVLPIAGAAGALVRLHPDLEKVERVLEVRRSGAEGTAPAP
jgi:release factor glutamine methyltransferase